MAILVVYITVWETYFTLYYIMLRRLQWLTHGAPFYQVRQTVGGASHRYRGGHGFQSR